MSSTQSIPLGEIPDRFEQVGLTPDAMADYLNILLQRWAALDESHHYEMTCNFIHNEMELNEEEAGMFLVYTVDELVRVAAAVRAVKLTGRLLAFTVSKYVILLTLAELAPPVKEISQRVYHMQRLSTPPTKEVPPEKVEVSVRRDGLAIIGQRRSLRQLGLLGEHELGEPAEKGSYFRSAWLLVWVDKEDPPIVYAANRDQVVAVMKLMEHRTNEQVTLEAGICGVEALLAPAVDA